MNHLISFFNSIKYKHRLTQDDQRNKAIKKLLVAMIINYNKDSVQSNEYIHKPYKPWNNNIKKLNLNIMNSN